MNKINKKGFLAGIMVDLYAYLAFVLVILIFFILFYVAKGDISEDVDKNIQDTTAAFVLTNYLRTPIDQHRTVADMISSCYIVSEINQDSILSDECKERLRYKTESVLFYSPEEYLSYQGTVYYYQPWKVVIYEMPSKNKFLTIGEVQKVYAIAQTQIPINGVHDKYLLVQIVRGDE